MRRHDDHLDDGPLDVLAAPPEADALLPPWQDVSRPAADRVADLRRRMTLAEKIGQLTSTWIGSSTTGGGMAPPGGPVRSAGRVEPADRQRAAARR